MMGQKQLSEFRHEATVRTGEAQQQYHFAIRYLSILRPHYYTAVKKGLKKHGSRGAWGNSSRPIWKVLGGHAADPKNEPAE
jgi:hypothetical protein